MLNSDKKTPEVQQEACRQNTKMTQKMKETTRWRFTHFAYYVYENSLILKQALSRKWVKHTKRKKTVWEYLICFNFFLILRLIFRVAFWFINKIERRVRRFSLYSLPRHMHFLTIDITHQNGSIFFFPGFPSACLHCPCVLHTVFFIH